MPTKPTVITKQPTIPNHRSWSGDGFYTSPAWINLRNAYRREHPLCVECKKKGIDTLMNVVDHVRPISQGGQKLEWVNLQSLCTKHHNSKSSKERNRKQS